MSSENKSSEVVGCDASIMMNVWEIRLREIGQKQQSEQQRVEKSALKTINKDWADRMASKHKYPKRLERKAKPVDTQDETQSIFNKRPKLPPPSRSLSPPRRVGGPGRGHAASAVPSQKEKKKGQEGLVRVSRLQLLMSIAQTQPSPMVWGKCWKYNKSLPPPTEGATAPSDWGQCWRLANQQPHDESGQPWADEPNMVDYHTLHLCGKDAFRMMETKDLDLIPEEEWQMSFKNANHPKGTGKKESSSSHDGNNVGKFWMFTSLDETQQHNEANSSSEWSESWKSTKPPTEGQQANDPADAPLDEQPHKDGKAVPQLECWKFVNNQLHYRSKSAPAKKSQNPEWADSWRAAKIISDDHKKPQLTPGQGQGKMYDFPQESQESPLHKVIMFVSREQKYRDLWSSQFRDEHQPQSEWDMSWEVTKNNSKPSEEMERIMKAGPPKMETPKVDTPKVDAPKVDTPKLDAPKVDAPKVDAPKVDAPKIDTPTMEVKKPTEPMAVDPHYEQLKHEVIYRPKRDFTEKMMHRLEHLDRTLKDSEWKEESWRTLKHRIRMERRRTRPHPSRPFREPAKGGERKPDASVWQESWKLTNLPLQQEADLWQQGWSGMPRIRPDRAMEETNFFSAEAKSWDDSWRFTRSQHRSEATGQKEQHEDPHHHSRRRERSVADWQDAWMVSESQFHHDRPSMLQWMEAWRWSAFHTDHWGEKMPRHNWMEKSLEIRSRKEKLPLQSAKAKMSTSFECQIFRERYPEKEWNESWIVASLLSHHQPSVVHKENTSHSDSQQPQPEPQPQPELQPEPQPQPELQPEPEPQPQPQTTSGEHVSKWGKSFRLANPMPHEMDQHWVDCAANQSHYTAMWSREKCIGSHVYANLNKDSEMFRLWMNSSRFLKGPSSQFSEGKHSKGKSKDSTGDRLEIMRKRMKTRKHIYINIDKCKPSDRKWAGCHLLGKTQPRPKRGATAVQTPKAAAETVDTFFEEWAESWKFCVKPGSLKKEMPVKSLSGWGESWKCLLPPYPPQKGKAK